MPNSHYHEDANKICHLELQHSGILLEMRSTNYLNNVEHNFAKFSINFKVFLILCLSALCVDLADVCLFLCVAEK